MKTLRQMDNIYAMIWFQFANRRKTKLEKFDFLFNSINSLFYSFAHYWQRKKKEYSLFVVSPDKWTFLIWKKANTHFVCTLKIDILFTTHERRWQHLFTIELYFWLWSISYEKSQYFFSYFLFCFFRSFRIFFLCIYSHNSKFSVWLRS